MNILVIAECVAMRTALSYLSDGESDRSSRTLQGLHEYEIHRVPLGALVLDAKYCELCGCNFLRRAKSKDRYCSKCRLTMLTVNGEEAGKLVSQLIH